MNLYFSPGNALWIIGSIILIALILAGYGTLVFLDRRDAPKFARHERDRTRERNRAFIVETIKALDEVVALHPELPPTAQITGDSVRGAGRISAPLIDFVFFIRTPMYAVYDNDSCTTAWYPDKKQLLMGGTLEGYTVTVIDGKETLRYTSGDGKLTVTGPSLKGDFTLDAPLLEPVPLTASAKTRK